MHVHALSDLSDLQYSHYSDSILGTTDASCEAHVTCAQPQCPHARDCPNGFPLTDAVSFMTTLSRSSMIYRDRHSLTL